MLWLGGTANGAAFGPPNFGARTAGRAAIHEPAIVAHDKVCFDAIDQIKHDADHDEHAGAAEELSHLVILRRSAEHVSRGERRNDGDHAKECGPDVGDAEHHIFQIIGGPLAGAETRDEGAVITQLVGHFLGLELDGVPEIGEEEDHGAEDDGVEVGAVVDVQMEERDDIGEVLVQPACIFAVFRNLAREPVEAHAWEQHKGTGEDDRHDAAVIDAQREILHLATINLPTTHLLGLLNLDAALGLGQIDRTGHDEDKAADQEDYGRESDFRGAHVFAYRLERPAHAAKITGEEPAEETFEDAREG